MGNSRVVLKSPSCWTISSVETGKMGEGGRRVWDGASPRIEIKESPFLDLEGPPQLAWGMWLV